MKTLVTGGGGFLGLYVTEQLVARGDSVRVLCRGTYPRFKELGVEHVQGDLRDADLVRAACEGIDCVFHTAAVPGIWGPWSKYHSINTVGTEHVIAGCRAAGVGRLVYTSTPSVVYDGKPHENVDEAYPYARDFLCHYPHSKMLAEQAVLKANSPELATVALRPHLIWGPRDNHLIPRLIARAKSGRLMRVGAGDNLISMTYVENGATAHLQAADRLTSDAPHAGKAYFINEPEPVNLWKWVDELLALAGRPPVKRVISQGTATRIGALLEGIYWTFRISSEPPMTRFLAAQLGSSHWYSIKGAQRDFGYTPLVTVEEGMRRLAPQLAELGRG